MNMDEAQAARWCLAMPTMAAYSQAIEGSNRIILRDK